MSGWELCTLGDPVLERPAAPVRGVDASLRRLVDAMFDAMYELGGVGLAAPQVGEGLAVFVYDLDPDGDRDPRVVLNPRIVSRRGLQQGSEGCLSVPGWAFELDAPARVHLVGEDLDGAPVDVVGEGLSARLFAHEVAHLQGRLLLERLTSSERAAVRASFRPGPFRLP